MLETVGAATGGHSERAAWRDPLADTQLPLARTAEGLARLAADAQSGKTVVAV